MDRLFLSIGAMKAGTTWLYSLLERHPDINFTPEKEIHFLAHHYVDKKYLTDRHRLHRAKTRLSRISHLRPARQQLIHSWYHNYYLKGNPSLTWYKNLFTKNDRQSRWNADFSNLSSLLPTEAWARISSELNTQVKTIYILREPCERLWSQYKFSENLQNSLSTSELKQHIKKFLNNSSTRRHSEYCRNYDSVYKGLGEQNIKIIMFDEIHAQPENLLASIEQFLEIAHKDHTGHDNLYRPINTTQPSPPPEIFRNLCAPIVEHELNGLKARGIVVPKRWMNTSI